MNWLKNAAKDDTNRIIVDEVAYLVDTDNGSISIENPNIFGLTLLLNSEKHRKQLAFLANVVLKDELGYQGATVKENWNVKHNSKTLKMDYEGVLLNEKQAGIVEHEQAEISKVQNILEKLNEHVQSLDELKQHENEDGELVEVEFLNEAITNLQNAKEKLNKFVGIETEEVDEMSMPPVKIEKSNLTVGDHVIDLKNTMSEDSEFGRIMEIKESKAKVDWGNRTSEIELNRLQKLSNEIPVSLTDKQEQKVDFSNILSELERKEKIRQQVTSILKETKFNNEYVTENLDYEFEKGAKVKVIKTAMIGTLKHFDYVKGTYVVDINGKELNFWPVEIIPTGKLDSDLF